MAGNGCDVIRLRSPLQEVPHPVGSARDGEISRLRRSLPAAFSSSRLG